jgi:hypothetical protein
LTPFSAQSRFPGEVVAADERSSRDLVHRLDNDAENLEARAIDIFVMDGVHQRFEARQHESDAIKARHGVGQ